MIRFPNRYHASTTPLAYGGEFSAEANYRELPRRPSDGEPCGRTFEKIERPHFDDTRLRKVLG